MTPERWQQISETFHVALGRDAAPREAFLSEVSATDPGLAREVESLLGAYAKAGHFGGRPFVSLPAPLQSGSLVGPYTVACLIGAGGMGEVYRAHDPRLGRDVALKVLPLQFTDHPERLAAFEREARLLASLNHPHIGSIYGLEQISDVASPQRRALIMEFVDGDDLADRISRGPIPIAEALAIAEQLSEALEAAHEQGVIHRDLKPSNIKVRDDGTVKLIDFGLARVLESSERSMDRAPSSGTTAPTPQTFGTAAYMSPERAQGRPSDQRADIWAFGAVFYEMITGCPLYAGATPEDTLRTLVEHEPDLDALPLTVPAAVRTMIARCLTKNPRYRLQAIAEARIVIEQTRGSSAIRPRPTADRAVSEPSPSHALLWCAAVAFALAALIAWRSPWRDSVSPSRSQRISAELGTEALLAIDTTAAAAAIAISPDGSAVAFVAVPREEGPPQIYVRKLDQTTAMALPGTEGAHGPFFSPDGRWLGFFADGQLKTISVSGGAAATICDAPNGRGGAWASDGTIVFSPDNRPYTRLLVVPASGGTPAPLPSPVEREWHQRWPQVLPDGKGVLYTANDAAGFNDASLVVQPLPEGVRKVVHRGGFHGRYVSSGHLIYVHDGRLFALPFDLDRLEATGPAVVILEEITSHDGTGGAQFDMSLQGAFVYLPGPGTSTQLPIHWLESQGPSTALRNTRSSWFNLRFSPDGRRIAMELCDEPACDVYVYDWARDHLARLTRDRAQDGEPVWTPDGGRLTFYSERGDGVTANLYWQGVDRPTEAQRLTDSKHVQLPGSWHPSGRFLAFEDRPAQNTGDLMILPMQGSEEAGWIPGIPSTFLNTPAIEREPMFSPDGRWLAYSSNESGTYEVYVRPFPGPGAESVISEGGGSYPTWSRTRQELYHGTPHGQLMAASYVAEAQTFRVEKARPWAEARYAVRGPNRMVDLHPDGQRFAIAPAQRVDPAKRDHVSIVFNFFDELKRLAPPAAK